MRLDELNALDRDAAERALLRCCGSTAWAARMADGRPFSNVDAMLDTADRVWNDCAAGDWLEAFAAHPKIGSSGSSGSSGSGPWSAQEQSGTRDAPGEVRDRLARGNRDYEARFGYIFIICATGKSADEMLAALERRLRNPPDVELGIAAGEQRQITRLRLLKLLGDEQRNNR